ncbi:MAG: transcriptional regulator [Myxococcota bacterium]
MESVREPQVGSVEDGANAPEGEAAMAAGGARARKRSSAAGRNDQVVRVLRLLRELERLGGVDLYELAQRYGTSVRTIRRDLDALREAGIPLAEEPSEDGPRKRWTVDGTALKSLSRLMDVSHYLALRLAMEQGGVVKEQSALFAALEDVAQRIEGALGQAGAEQLKAVDACFFSWEKFAWAKAAPEVLWPLVTAIADKRLCRVTYRAPNSGAEGKSFRVLPLRLFVHQGAVYLHAWVPRFGSVVTLNLHRLVSLEALAEKAEWPAGYSTSDFEHSAFGVFTGTAPVRYHLRFTKAVAPYIRERVWHPSQKLTEREDGGVELTFECAESYEVLAWIASWRQEVEVVEPARLRSTLKDFGVWLVETYR